MEPILTPILIGGLVGKTIGSIFGRQQEGVYDTQPDLGSLTVLRNDGPPTTRPLDMHLGLAEPTALGTSVFEDAIKGVRRLTKTWDTKEARASDVALLMSKDQGYVAVPLRAYQTYTHTKNLWGDYSTEPSDPFPRMLHDRGTIGAELQPGPPGYRQSAEPFIFADGSQKPTSADLHAVIGQRQLIDLRPTAGGKPPVIANRPRQKFLGIF